jgi:hypothetical protein
VGRIHGEEPDGRRLRCDRRAAQRHTGKLIGLVDLLDEHGDEIEADLQSEYRIDLCDFYRGELSARRLGVLVRQLPVTSRAVEAIDGRPGWTPTDHLLADLWSLIARAYSEKGSLPEDFDHPTRAEMIVKAIAAAKAELKAFYLKRKRAYRLPVQSGRSGQ